MENKSATRSPSENDISTYDGRLITFGTAMPFPHANHASSKRRQWPETAAVDPSKLARAGFFLNEDGISEEDDTVECFACHRRVSNWKFNDSVLRRHREACADCPFLNKIMPQEQKSVASGTGRIRTAFNTRGFLSDPFANCSSSVTPRSPVTADLCVNGGQRRPFWSVSSAVANLGEVPSNSNTLPASAEAGSDAGSAPQPTTYGGSENLAAEDQNDGRSMQHFQSFPESRFAGRTSAENDNDVSTNSDAHAAGVTNAHADILRTSLSNISDADNVFNATPTGSFVADAASLMGFDDSPDPSADGATLSYSPRLAHPAQQQVPEYFGYDARLRSFTSHSHTWPISHVTPADLAEAGFFYTGEMDKVQCAFCAGVLSRFQPGENAWNEHIKFYPTCPLVRNRLASARSSRRQNTKFQHGLVSEVNSAVEYSVPRITLRRNSEDGLADDVAGDNAGQDVTGIYADTMTNAELTGRANTVPHRHVSHRASSPPASEDYSDEELGILSNCPKRPDLATVDARIATFITTSPAGAVWPQHDVQQTPSQLAEAGLYYIGAKDCTKCFFCDGSLNGWQRGDDPFIEHARFFPNCGYLLSIKGRSFVEAAVADHCPTSHSPPASRRQSNLATPTASGASQPLASTILSSPSSASSSSTPTATMTATATEKFVSSFNQQLRVPDRFVQQARQLGFTDLRIRQAIEALSRGQRRSSAAAAASDDKPALVLSTFGPLLQHILCGVDKIASDESAGNLPKQSLFDRFNSDPTGASKKCASGTNVGARQDKYASLGDESTLPPPPSQQNSSSGTLPVTTCKICMDREVGVAFLPCSHLVSCAYCAPALKFCPVCRSPIKKIFKTYLS